MKVKDLIDLLKDFDPNLDVWIEDIIEGNACEVNKEDIFIRETHMTEKGKDYFGEVLFIFGEKR